MISELSNRIYEGVGYRFRNDRLLITALSHSSYANENKSQSNERLEFLGDSVLELVSSQFLYNKYPKLPEGELSKLRAALVCEQALNIYAATFGLSDCLLLGRGEENTGGRKRPSIIADAFEAILGAAFLDGGFESIREVIYKFLSEYSEKALEGLTFKDYKTILQEIVQKNPGDLLSYVHTGESGPDHNKLFRCEIHINSNVISSAEGKSKKDAEQNAAELALKLLGVE